MDQEKAPAKKKNVVEAQNSADQQKEVIKKDKPVRELKRTDAQNCSV